MKIFETIKNVLKTLINKITSLFKKNNDDAIAPNEAPEAPVETEATESSETEETTSEPTVEANATEPETTENTEAVSSNEETTSEPTVEANATEPEVKSETVTANFVMYDAPTSEPTVEANATEPEAKSSDDSIIKRVACCTTKKAAKILKHSRNLNGHEKAIDNNAEYKIVFSNSSLVPDTDVCEFKGTWSEIEHLIAAVKITEYVVFSGDHRVCSDLSPAKTEA